MDKQQVEIAIQMSKHLDILISVWNKKKYVFFWEKKSKIVVRLDSSPPQFLNDQTDRRTDKPQIELATQIGEHSCMPM